MLISFVIPCYKSVNTLPDVVDTIQKTVASREDVEAEIILVNDASPDGTWDVIKDLHDRYDNVMGVNIAKNSGQQSAIMAGLRHASGDLVAVSDDDGQTPIETIFEFYECMQEGGYDVVCADYHGRGKRSAFRRLGSWANNEMARMFMDKPEDLSLSVYFLAKRFVIEEMIRYTNAYPHMEGLLIRTTRNIGNVQVDQKERASGSSGYNLKKLLSTWINGLTTFSIKPLRLAVFFGMLIGIVVALVRLSDFKILRWLGNVYVDFIRGTPLLIQIFLVYFALPSIIGHRVDAFFAAISACSINSGIDVGQMEAGRSLGMTWWQTMRYIILPQAFKRIIPPLGNEFIAMLKDSSLVSVIGFEELTRRGQLIIARTYASFEIWMAVAIIYLILTFTVARLTGLLERKFDTK